MFSPFNFRFIKMFWHTDKGNIKDRLGNSGAQNQGKFTRTITNEEKVPEVCSLAANRVLIIILN